MGNDIAVQQTHANVGERNGTLNDDDEYDNTKIIFLKIYNILTKIIK